MRQVEWVVAKSTLRGPADQLHVWFASLARSKEELNRFRCALSRDELDRATRLLRPIDGERYVAAHGILRDILSRYLGQEPESLTFTSGTHGKPALVEGGVRAPNLCFNLSHSHECALYAISQSREVGIDLEYTRRTIDGMGLARRFFSQQEYDALALLSGETQTRRFFECWTCREAFLKARGTGLQFPLSGLRVDLSSHGNKAKIQYLKTDREVGHYSLRRFVPLKDYIGALAVEGADLPVRWWQWEPKDR